MAPVLGGYCLCTITFLPVKYFMVNTATLTHINTHQSRCVLYCEADKKYVFDIHCENIIYNLYDFWRPFWLLTFYPSMLQWSCCFNTRSFTHAKDGWPGVYVNLRSESPHSTARILHHFHSHIPMSFWSPKHFLASGTITPYTPAHINTLLHCSILGQTNWWLHILMTTVGGNWLCKHL